MGIHLCGRTPQRVNLELKSKCEKITVQTWLMCGKLTIFYTWKKISLGFTVW